LEEKAIDKHEEYENGQRFLSTVEKTSRKEKNNRAFSSEW